jgi:hypothetical protein
MANLIVYTNLSAADALSAGSPIAGRLTVQPTTEQLQDLAADERVALQTYCGLDVDQNSRRWDGVLDVTTIGWDGVVAGLRAEISARETERAKREHEIEAERAGYRVVLAAAVLYEPGLPLRRREIDGGRGLSPNYGRSDEETERLWSAVRAREASEREAIIRAADDALAYDVVNGELAPPIQLVLGTRDNESRDVHRQLAPRAWSFADRLADEIAATKAAAVEAAHALAREYVIAHVPDYVRAVEDGCDVRGVAVRHLESDLVKHAMTPETTMLEWSEAGPPEANARRWWRYDDDAVGKVESHSCPNALAYGRLAVVDALAEEFRGSLLVESIETRIVRVKLHGEWRTCAELSAVTKPTLPDVVDLYLYADAAQVPCDDDSDD